MPECIERISNDQKVKLDPVERKKEKERKKIPFESDKKRKREKEEKEDDDWNSIRVSQKSHWQIVCCHWKIFLLREIYEKLQDK